MKPEACVINVARGGVIDEAALARGADRGHHRRRRRRRLLERAARPLTTRCARAPNIILTPHLGASTEEAQTRVAVEACEQVRDVLAGRPARYAVNAPLMTPETADALAPYLPLARMLGQFYAQFCRSLSGLTLEVARRAGRVRLGAPRGGRARGHPRDPHRGTRQRRQRALAGQGPRHQPRRPQDGGCGPLLVAAHPARRALRLGHRGVRRVAARGPRRLRGRPGPGHAHARLAAPGPPRRHRPRGPDPRRG